MTETQLKTLQKYYFDQYHLIDLLDLDGRPIASVYFETLVGERWLRMRTPEGGYIEFSHANLWANFSQNYLQVVR